MVGEPPSHSAINKRWGPGLEERGSPRSQFPTNIPNPNPDLEKGRCQRREVSHLGTQKPLASNFAAYVAVHNPRIS
jgi:hypothetical protein